MAMAKKMGSSGPMQKMRKRGPRMDDAEPPRAKRPKSRKTPSIAKGLAPGGGWNKYTSRVRSGAKQTRKSGSSFMS